MKNYFCWFLLSIALVACSFGQTDLTLGTEINIPSTPFYLQPLSNYELKELDLGLGLVAPVLADRPHKPSFLIIGNQIPPERDLDSWLRERFSNSPFDEPTPITINNIRGMLARYGGDNSEEVVIASRIVFVSEQNGLIISVTSSLSAVDNAHQMLMAMANSIRVDVNQ